MSPARKNAEGLSSVVKIGAVIMVVCLGLWGCARKPVGRATGDSKVLDSKVQKLEQDLRTAAGARDKARKELATVEAEAARLQQEATEKAALAQDKATLLEKIQAEKNELNKQLLARTSERDELRHQINLRTQERDSLLSRVDRIRKGLQQLVTQDDSPASLLPGGPGAPTVPATPTAGQVVPAGPALGAQS